MESMSQNMNSDGTMRDQMAFQNSGNWSCLGNSFGYIVGTYNAGPWDISGGIFGAGFNASFESGQAEGNKGSNFPSNGTLYTATPWVHDSCSGGDQQRQQQVGVIYSVATPQTDMSQGEPTQNYMYTVDQSWTHVQPTRDFGPAHAVEASGSWSNSERGKGGGAAFHASSARHARGQWFHGNSANSDKYTDHRQNRSQSFEPAQSRNSGKNQGSSHNDDTDENNGQTIEDGSFELELLTPIASVGGDPVPPPSSQEERQLLGEVLFLRAWQIVRSVVAPEEAPKVCGKTVGMLLQQDRPEESLQNQSALQSRVNGALRALGVDTTPGKQKRKDASTSSASLPQEVSSADIFPPGMRPPAERHGDLLYMAVSVLVGDSRVASKVTGMILANFPNDIAKCLTQDKVLRPHVRTALRSLEREQNEEHDAHKLLEEFHGMDTLGRVEQLKRTSEQVNDAAGEQSGGQQDSGAWTSYVYSLLKAALKYTRTPAVVAKEVARSLAVAGLTPSQQIVNLLDRCGLRRAELPRLGLRLSRHAHMSGRSQNHFTTATQGRPEGTPFGRSFASARRRSHSPTKAKDSARIEETSNSMFANEAETRMPQANEDLASRKQPEGELKEGKESEVASRYSIAEATALRETEGAAASYATEAQMAPATHAEKEREIASYATKVKSASIPHAGISILSKVAPAVREGIGGASFPTLRSLSVPTDRFRANRDVLAPNLPEGDTNAPKSGEILGKPKQMKDGPESPGADSSPMKNDIGPTQLLQRKTPGPRMFMDGLLPLSIPEEGEGKKKKKNAFVVEATPEPEPAKETKRGPKKKGHSYTPMDVFSESRQRAKSAGPTAERGNGSSSIMDESAKSRSETSRNATVAKNMANSITAHEAKVQLMALAEAKLQAVQNEDFELAARLKVEERSLQSIASQGSSWADIAGSSAGKAGPQMRGRAPWAQSLASNGFRASSENPRAASSSLDPNLRMRAGAGGAVSSTSHPSMTSSQAKVGEPVVRQGGIAFFLTAPGQLTLDTFKPTSTHVSRRDALARIASAALWRGRGLSWDTAKEIAFLFEDDNMIRMSSRFTISCPVPSEFQLISVLGRGIEKENVLGLQIAEAEAGKAFGGHVERFIGEHAKAGRTAVVLLHETHPLNLGIYTTPAESDGDLTKDDDRTLIFFLGAVKDMTPEETKAVHRACKLYNVPCVEANLGQQAEFTSKIIDVLHGHHTFGRLMPAAWRCARRRCGSSEGIPLGGLQTFKPAVGAFWVFIPIGGSPRELAHDDKKKDGMYEIPRSCISQLWCSKGEHKGQIVSFVFSTGEILTVHPTLVTCLKLQHRAAPTERNLVNALRVGMGDQRADPALQIDDGCVALGDVASLSRTSSEVKLSRKSAAFIDFSLGGDDLSGPRLMAYSVPESEQSLESMGMSARDIPRDVVVLLHQSTGRDFPKGFREKLANALLGEKSSDSSTPAPEKKPNSHARWRRMSLPLMSVNAAISLLSHYRQTGVLGLALLSKPPEDTRKAEHVRDKPAEDITRKAEHVRDKPAEDRTSQDSTKPEPSSSDPAARKLRVLRRGEPTSNDAVIERHGKDARRPESSSSDLAVRRPNTTRQLGLSSNDSAVERVARSVGRERPAVSRNSAVHRAGEEGDLDVKPSRRSQSPPPWRRSKGVEIEARPRQSARHAEDKIQQDPVRHINRGSASEEPIADSWERWLDEQ